MNQQTIYVLSYPKSGGTWLARLLGDALNSPVGGINAVEDDKAMATEGQNRPGSYYIRHGHAVPVETGEVLIPDRFSFAYKNLTDERVVILLRDPRDVAVSAAAYWGRDLTTILHCMGRGEWPLTHGGGWVKWVRGWWGVMLNDSPWTISKHKLPFYTFYESLIAYPVKSTSLALQSVTYGAFNGDVQESIARQSMTSRRAWTEQHGDSLNYGKEAQLRFLRKGVVGDWENHFTPEHKRLAEGYFGETMRELGYTKARGWVNE